MKVLKTAPAKEVFTVQQVCDHLQIITTDESFDAAIQDYIDRLIKVARKHFEQTILGRALITQTWYYYLDDFPPENFIRLPYPPLQSVTSLKYTDSSGTITTWTASGNYTVDTKNEPGRVVLTYLNSWPTAILSPDNPIEIEFICGYGSEADNVPEGIRQAMLIFMADLYDHRGDLTTISLNNIKAVDRLVSEYRVTTQL